MHTILQTMPSVPVNICRPLEFDDINTKLHTSAKFNTFACLQKEDVQRAHASEKSDQNSCILTKLPTSLLTFQMLDFTHTC